MPQMAPMNWTLIYFMFSMIFIMFNFMNYYNFSYKNNLLKTKSLLNKFFWKW
uniref:ATP synthase complex subunit 8 n=1 Tax=Pselaphinae sp. 12 EF-2015 TaxID=1756871 RepID=A0A0S2M8G6_9COLE|nr:ATP synthase F0 subunit 8 [Pselaphinae sp. 12 EF-2015]